MASLASLVRVHRRVDDREVGVGGLSLSAQRREKVLWSTPSGVQSYWGILLESSSVPTINNNNNRDFYICKCCREHGAAVVRRIIRIETIIFNDVSKDIIAECSNTPRFSPKEKRWPAEGG